MNPPNKPTYDELVVLMRDLIKYGCTWRCPACEANRMPDGEFRHAKGCPYKEAMSFIDKIDNPCSTTPDTSRLSSDSGPTHE